MSWDKVGKDVESGPFGLFKWIFIAIVVLTLLGAGLNAILRPAEVAVDRAVMKNSFQYQAGMEQRAATLEAQIAELDVLIANATTSEERQRLQQQKSVFRAQLRAITINE